jgi:hypothetical protein
MYFISSKFSKHKKNQSRNIYSDFLGAGDRNRTGTGFDSRRILSPVRLPVPPPRHVVNITCKYSNINFFKRLLYK